MKQGLSLRVSQHLALTPQLQQSIRLLQLSTLELGQEVEQMLDENPFLELNTDEAPREEFGLPAADAPVREDDREAESLQSSAIDSIADYADSTRAEAPNDAEPVITAEEPQWDGDGTTDMVPDDGEWGGDAPARKNNLGDDDEVDATELARSQESLQSYLHRQALSLRLSELDSAALRFLIESLNDDGYLDDSIEELALGLVGRDDEQLDELVHRFTVALRLLHHLDPPGVGARTLGECLSLQLKARRELGDCDTVCEVALRICEQPMELLARRDIKRLVQLCAASDSERATQHLQRALELTQGRSGAALQEIREGAQLRAARWALDERDVQASLGWLEALPGGAQRRTVALRIRLKAARLARQTSIALETARLLAKHRAFSPEAAQSLVRGLMGDLIQGAHDLAQLQRVWNGLDASERLMPDIAIQAARRLLEVNGYQVAETQIDASSAVLLRPSGEHIIAFMARSEGTRLNSSH